jgi:hypothetical protein
VKAVEEDLVEESNNSRSAGFCVLPTQTKRIDLPPFTLIYQNFAGNSAGNKQILKKTKAQEFVLSPCYY